MQAPVIQRFSTLWFNLSLRNKGAAVIAIPVICLVTSLAAFGVLQRQINQSEQWVKHTQEVRIHSEQILRTLVDAETAVRGYDLTHKPEFLQPYQQSLSLLPSSLKILSSLVRDNPLQTSKVKEIDHLVQRKLALMQSNIELINTTKDAVDREQLVQLLDQGKVRMDTIRQRMDQFMQAEEQLLQERGQILRQQRDMATGVLWLASLVGIAGGLAAHSLYSVGVVKRIRQVQDNARQVAQGQPLMALLPGQDEVSQLDQVLHITAEQIAQREAQLREANLLIAEAVRKEKALISNSLDVICSIDAEGKFVDINPACFQLWGYTPEELVGRPYIELVDPEDVEKTNAVAVEIVSGKAVSGFENRYRRKDGSWVDLMWSATWSESEQLMFCVARDITERKEVEQLKNEFISTVNHELRTPLTSLRGFSELLLKKQFSPEKQHQYLTIICSETKRLTNLINDFLDIQRIESGGQNYYFETVDISLLLHDVVLLFAPNNQQHTFNVEVPDSLPPVKADSDRIRQVLSNLISNAIKYAPVGGEITISAQDEGAAIRVSVADQGVGMTPEAMEKLFTKFYRIDNADTRKIGGTGLGLVLVKAIVEAHDGNIEVESKPGKGSIFSFTLPKAQLPSPLLFSEKVSTAAIDVLIVEDDESFSKLLQDQFESIGLNVVATAFAEEALQLLEQNLPRSIILDIHLAGSMDGWDFLTALRSKSNPKVLSTPVIIITISSDPNVRGLAFRGAEYLPKSVAPEVLVQTVQYHLSQLSGKNILVVDDDAAYRQHIIEAFSPEYNIHFREAANGREALVQVQQQMPDLLILDLMMPEVDGFEVLKQLRMNRDAFELPVLVVTGISLSVEEKDYLKARMATLANKQKASIETLTQIIEQTLSS